MPAMGAGERERATYDAMKRRLGRYSTGAWRDLRAAARVTEDEELVAVVIGMWRRRGWVIVATDGGLRLARHPLVLGRRAVHRFEWADLSDVEAWPMGIALTFGADVVALAATGPPAEFERLTDLARGTAGGADRVPVDELRALARTKLGRLSAYGYEPVVQALPDHLEPEERVERLAGASLDFSGLLVLADGAEWTLTGFVPRERRDEFAVALARPK